MEKHESEPRGSFSTCLPVAINANQTEGGPVRKGCPDSVRHRQAEREKPGYGLEIPVFGLQGKAIAQTQLGDQAVAGGMHRVALRTADSINGGGAKIIGMVECGGGLEGGQQRGDALRLRISVRAGFRSVSKRRKPFPD